MGKINMSRLVLGGIIAGIVADALGYLVDGVMLAPRWAEGMKALGHSEFSPNQWIWFNLLGLVVGLSRSGFMLRSGLASAPDRGRRSTPGWPCGSLERCCRTSVSCASGAFSRAT